MATSVFLGGDVNATEIAGIPLAVSNPQAGDVLTYEADEWVNAPPAPATFEVLTADPVAPENNRYWMSIVNGFLSLKARISGNTVPVATTDTN